MHWEWCGRWFGGIGMALFWIVAILVIIWLVRSLMNSKGQDKQHMQISQSPLEILQQRYAKGEISKEEYLEMKKELAKK